MQTLQPELHVLKFTSLECYRFYKGRTLAEEHRTMWHEGNSFFVACVLCGCLVDLS